MSLVGESVEKPLDYFDNNVGGSIRLLEAMRDRGVKQFVFSSSAAVYGAPDALPIEETAPCRPENPYGATKLMVENILASCRAAWGLSYVALRYFNAGGSTEARGEDHTPETHLIPIVLDTALGRRKTFSIFGDDYETPDGTCIRDYIHVVDLARAHVLALEAMGTGFSGALNLGSEDPFTVLEVVRRTEAVTGSPVAYEVGPRRPGDPPALLASSRKAAEVLGWKQQHSTLEEIVESAWKWRQANPDGYPA
jgi:UDP-glucose 4-epimerase